MRIGINCSFVRKPNTGIGQVSLNFLNALIEKESRLANSQREYVIYLEEDIDLELPDNFKKEVFLPLWRRDDLIRKFQWESRLLVKKARKDKIDIFISLYQCPTIFGSLSKIKHIMVAHDLIPRLFPEYANNFRKKYYQESIEKALGKVDKIISISHQTEKDLIKHLNADPKKISVQYIDVDPIYKKEITESKLDKILAGYQLKKGYIYYAGGLDKRKNVESLLQAYKHLLSDNEKVKFIEIMPPLVIAGKLMPHLAPLITDVQKISQDLGIQKHIKFLDFAPQEDMPALYRGAQIFVYPSLYEGFGLPVLEAMNQGAPVITSKKTSLPEVGADSVLYCDPSDAMDIKMVMKKLIKDADLRKVLSEKGKKRAKKFSWDIFINKIINIIYCGLS